MATVIPWYIYSGIDPNITVVYELTIGKHTWEPGDQIRVKNSKLVHIFGHHAKNSKTGTEWVTLFAADGYHSVRLDKVFVPAKARKK